MHFVFPTQVALFPPTHKGATHYVPTSVFRVFFRGACTFRRFHFAGPTTFYFDDQSDDYNHYRAFFGYNLDYYVEVGFEETAEAAEA